MEMRTVRTHTRTHLGSGEVRQRKRLELALLVHLVHRLERLLEGHAPIRRMEIVYVRVVRRQGVEARLVEPLERVGLVHPRLVRITRRGESNLSAKTAGGLGCRVAGVEGDHSPLRGDLEAALLVARLRGPALLCAPDVRSRGIDLVVARRLEVVEVFLVFVEAGDPSARRGVGAERHAGGKRDGARRKGGGGGEEGGGGSRISGRALLNGAIESTCHPRMILFFWFGMVLFGWGRCIVVLVRGREVDEGRDTDGCGGCLI